MLAHVLGCKRIAWPYRHACLATHLVLLGVMVDDWHRAVHVGVETLADDVRLVARSAARLTALQQAPLHHRLGALVQQHTLHFHLQDRTSRAGTRHKRCVSTRPACSCQRHLLHHCPLVLPHLPLTSTPTIRCQPSRLGMSRGKPSMRNLQPPDAAIAFLSSLMVISTCKQADR